MLDCYYNEVFLIVMHFSHRFAFYYCFLSIFFSTFVSALFLSWRLFKQIFSTVHVLGLLGLLSFLLFIFFFWEQSKLNVYTKPRIENRQNCNLVQVHTELYIICLLSISFSFFSASALE